MSPGLGRNQSAFGFLSDLPVAERTFRVGVVGATGLVGKTLIRVLKERNFPIGDLRLFASSDSEGLWVDTPFGQCCMEVLNPKKPPHLDFAFLAAGTAGARSWGWRLKRRGAVVIDKSSYFRDKSYAPLIVPEVNGETLGGHLGIIANPNCTTIPLVMVLEVLRRLFGLMRVAVVTFQSVSGAGREGLAALEGELAGIKPKSSPFPRNINHNLIPWIGETGGAHSGEERKIVTETRRILNLSRLSIRATAVRVPTMVGHALAVHADCRRTVNIRALRRGLREFAGIKVVDDPEKGRWPTPLDAAGHDEVLVGRIRRDRGRTGVALWVVADNLRKGATVNAVQIAERVIAELALDAVH